MTLIRYVLPLAAFLVLTGNGEVCTNAYDITLQHIRQSKKARTPFDLTGTVIQPRIARGQPLLVRDHTGTASIFDHIDYPLIKANCQPGDLVRVIGNIETNEFGSIAAQATHVTILGHGPKPPDTSDISAAQLQSLRFDNCKVRLRGLVIEARHDETDPNFIFLMLHDKTDTAFVSLPANTDIDLSSYIGAEIEVTGTARFPLSDKRPFMHQEVSVSSFNNIKILRHPTTDPISTPPIDQLHGLPPSQLSRLGLHHANGKVIAVLNDGSVFFKTSGRFGICRAELTSEPSPRFGDSIEVTGIPATDLYHIILLHANWRSIPPLDIKLSPIRDVHADDLPTVGAYIGRETLKTHGALVRLNGTVQKAPNTATGEHLMLLDSDNRLVSVEATPLISQSIAIGSKVEVTGVCVLDIELWHPNTSFARVKSATIVPRSAADIRILAQPPWWTPFRLTTTIGILLAGLLAILAWNIALRRAAIRKGRELMRNQLGVEREKLKTEERTRLAVELHDTLAQNLTGVALEVDTALQLCDKNGEQLNLLTIASRALRSCCADLRNSIWDLRNEALDIPDMDEAIRQTVVLHSGNAEIDVDFHVPRRLLGDDTVHVILRIVRELTINSVRHGDATNIRIKGNRYGSKLLICVRDNGCGFDATCAPGIAEGHFGLQGIRERIKSFNGAFALKSIRGLGTLATIKMEISDHG